MTTLDHDHHRMMARLTISVGALAMCADHWFGPFGDEPGILFFLGAMFVAIGVVGIPKRPSATQP